MQTAIINAYLDNVHRLTLSYTCEKLSIILFIFFKECDVFSTCNVENREIDQMKCNIIARQETQSDQGYLITLQHDLDNLTGQSPYSNKVADQ